MASVAVPESLARLFPGMPRRLDAAGDTVSEVIDDIESRHRGFRDRVLDTRTRIRRHVLVFVDGELARVDTPVPEGAEVTIVPALSGGA